MAAAQILRHEEASFPVCESAGTQAVCDVCPSHSLSRSGDVCVRVPASLKAGVELRGAAVHVDSEVVMHRTEHKPAENPTTVMGKLLFFFPFYIPFCTFIMKLNSLTQTFIPLRLY